MDLKISKRALQISCFQVLPGTENDVAARLKIKCQTIPHAILKGFGAFDIVLIHVTPNFEHSLPKELPEESILKISQFPCFGYQIDNIEEVIEALSRSTFVGVSLLKLEDSLSQSYEDIKTDVFTRLTKEESDVERYVLGTLGWYELIVLTMSNSVNKVISDLLWTTAANDQNHILKTFSIVSINYGEIPIFHKNMKNISNIQKKLEANTNLKSIIENDIQVSLYISLKPGDTLHAFAFWNNCHFKVCHTIGKDDLIVVPKEDISWSFLLAHLYTFRRELSERILSTNLRIYKACEYGAVKPVDGKIHHQGQIVNYDFDEYRKFFGRDAALRLTHILDYLNSLSQNPIIGNAFSDIVLYVDNINRLVDEDNPDVKNERFARQAATVLKHGTEVRFQGTYASIEEPTSQFSLIKGGLQRVFLAIEGLVSSVFSTRFGAGWEGFVITGIDKFSNINEILNVPIEAMNKPVHWWALYHEIAHVFIDYIKLPREAGDETIPKLVDFDVPQIRAFLANKDYQEGYLTLINELAAEIIGFELGFYGDIDLFLQLVWKYLEELNKSQKQADYDQYLLRTFTVEMYFNYIKTGKSSLLKDLDFIYKSFIAHIRRVEGITSVTIGRRYYIAVNNIKAIHDLVPYLEYVKTSIELFKLPTRSELATKNTMDAFIWIKEGKVWLDDIHTPEAILYKLIKDERLDFKTSIAFTLSLWNKQRCLQKGIN